MTLPPRDLAVRVALLVWLVGWLTKAGVLMVGFTSFGWHVAVESQALLAARWIPLVAYLGPVPLVIAAVALGGRIAGALAAAAGLGCAAMLLVHVTTYGDAAFVTAFWAALWLLWASLVSDAEVMRWGPRLAQGVIALIFLGGALGKLTPEYWNGTVLYDITVRDQPSWLYRGLRASLEPEQVRALATGFSRLVTVSELALATSVLWPSRIALAAAAVAGIGMAATSTLQVFAATGAVTALGLGGLVLTGLPRELWDRVAAVGAQPEEREVVARRVFGG